MSGAGDEEFGRLRILGDPAMNRSLLERLEEREEARPLLAANLARRGGDLDGARLRFERHLGRALPGGAVTPWGRWGPTGLATAPVVVIDGYLPPAEAEELYRHALAIEDRFEPAGIVTDRMEVDLDRRRTLMTHRFGARAAFEAAAREMPGRHGPALGMPPFEIDSVSLKMTCHVDGGFFRTHSDNPLPFGQAGRVVTFLYYFGADPPRHRGGELLIFDSDPSRRAYSDEWFTTVAPLPNRLVVFPSCFHHAVMPTRVEEGGFAAGRFAIGGHIYKPAGGDGWWADRTGGGP